MPTNSKPDPAADLDDDLRPEYDLSQLQQVHPRGYYAAWYHAGPPILPKEPPTRGERLRAWLAARFARLIHRHSQP